MTEKELKKYSYEELLKMYYQLKEEMERRGLYEKYLEEKGLKRYLEEQEDKCQKITKNQ